MAKIKYKPGKDGIYRTKAWDGTYNEDGSKHRVNLKSQKSSGDLEKQVNALKDKIKAGMQVQTSDITFVDYAKQWRKTYKCTCATATKNMYDNVISKHLSSLGLLKLQDVRKSHLQLLINTRFEKPRTCQQIIMTFKQVVRSAIADKLLPAASEMDIFTGISVPRYRPEEKRPLHPEEVTALQKADLLPMEKAFVLIIYGCGLRRGEAIAINKHLDIDLKRSQLTVRQAVEFDGNNPAIKTPKTENGYRTVPMPAFLCDYLKVYAPTVKGNYLVSKKDGSLMTKSSYDKMWEQILKKLNLAAGGTDKLHVIYGLTAHIFRHNYCTNLCYQVPKISIKKIAQLMGDTEKMVNEVYSHIMEEKENVDEVVASAICL